MRQPTCCIERQKQLSKKNKAKRWVFFENFRSPRTGTHATMSTISLVFAAFVAFCPIPSRGVPFLRCNFVQYNFDVVGRLISEIWIWNWENSIFNSLNSIRISG